MTSHAKGDVPGYCGRKDIYEEDARLYGASVADLHNLTDDFETEHKRPRLEVEYLLDESLDVIKSFLKNDSEELAFIESTAADLRRTVGGF